MKKVEKVKGFLGRRGHVLVWILAACCGLLIILSYCFPKMAYDITEHHVVLEEDEEKAGIVLTADTRITYYLDVNKKTICGIQPCFSWGSDSYPNGKIVVDAWHEESFPAEESYIGGVEVSLDERLQEAYVYAEIPGGEELSGKLVFTIQYIPTGLEEQLPQIIVGTKNAAYSKTLVNDEAVDGDLLMYYASIQKTYPLVFDAKMMLLLLSAVAALMTAGHYKMPEKRSIAKLMEGHSFGKKKILCMVVAGVIVLLSGALVELLVYNGRVFKEGAYFETVQMQGTEVEICFEQEKYIKTIILEGNCEENAEFQVEILDQNDKTIAVIEETLDARLDRSVLNLRETGSKVVVRCLADDAGAWNVTVADFYEWNSIRFLFWVSVFGLVAYFIIGKRSFARNPEIVFAVICLLTGGMLILITGTNQISYDEQTHVAQVWNLSYIGMVYDTDAALACKTLTVPEFHNIWERRDVASYLNSINDYETAGIFYTSKMISYNQRAYLPMAVFMAIGRSLALPFATMISLSKFGNLLIYTVVCAIAIRVAKKGKGLVAVLALLPNSVFLASQFSYDAFVNCFLLLAMVLVMNEMVEPEKKCEPRNMLAILACFVVGSYSKQIYVLMALMMLFWGNQKFSSKKKAILFKAILFVLCCVMVYEVVSPSYSGVSAAETISDAGDKRVEGTGMLAQITYIVNRPFIYMKLLISSMFIRIYEWFSGANAFHMYGYMGTPGTVFTWIWFAAWGLAAVVTTQEEERYGIGKRLKIGTALVITGMAAVIWTVLYLSFNVVGNQSIEGVQNRYFTPLLLPVGMCLFNRCMKWKWTEEAYYKLLFGISAFVLVYCSYALGIRPWYL